MSKPFIEKPARRAVNQLTLEGVFIKEFKKMKDASVETKTNFGSIANCCRGKAKSAGGFKWEYNNKYFTLPKDPLDDLLFIEEDEEIEF